jgi:hypothetical protein
MNLGHLVDAKRADADHRMALVNQSGLGANKRLNGRPIEATLLVEDRGSIGEVGRLDPEKIGSKRRFSLPVTQRRSPGPRLRYR